MSSPRLHRTRSLVGRGVQLDVAAAHLDDLEQARGGLLVLTGEPGIGKSRLAEAIVERAAARGARAVWATAWRGDGTPALWPWVQVLRQLTGSAELLDQPEPETPTASSAARFAQLESIAGRIGEAAAREPLVLVLDDLHWADAGSVRVLVFVASAIRDVRCLVVATYRPDELSRDEQAELARVGTTLAVPRLSDDEAAELLHASVGVDVAPDATATVVARSGGNPLFVWELGQLMAQSGRADAPPAAIPTAVAAVIERRLARVAEEVVAILRVAAVAGSSFSTALVATMADQPLDHVAGTFDTASTAGLIRPTDIRSTFAFTHDLVRDVVLDGLGAARRAELHERAAAALEPRLRTDPSYHAVVADHLECAGAAHDAAASEHWEHAARRARTVLAYEESATFFARAARTCTDDPARHGALLVDEGDSLLLTGDLAAARARFNEAAAIARVIEQPELLARAVLGIGTGAVAWEVPMGSGELAALVVDALALLPADALRLRSMLLARLSVAASTPETQDVARARAEEALALADQLGDPALLGQALAALNDALAGPAHTMTRRDNADTIVELGIAAGDRALQLLGHRFLVVADLELGDIGAVDRDIAAFTRLAEALQQPLLGWYVPLFHGIRALLAGDIETADRHQAEVAAAAEATGSVNAVMMAVTLEFGIATACGRPMPGDALDTIIETDPADWAVVAAGEAFARWQAGDVSGARALLDLHARNGFARLGDDGEHLVTLMMFGRVATGLGDLVAVERLYELLRPHSGLWAVDGIAGCCWGPIDMDLGRLALALGRDADTRGHHAAARRSADAVGATLLTAEIDALPGGPTERPDPEVAEVAGNVFRLEGQFWTLHYRDRTVRLKDSKGLRDLDRLVAEPGRELHVLDLAGSTRATGDGTAVSTSDLGELLDARARAEYRRRLAELDEELAGADETGDADRAAKAHAERTFLADELAAALGIGGRPRRVGDPAERARKAVTARIWMAIGRIGEEHPELARHLTNAVRTGKYCVYEPEVMTIWER